jgi:hypothetical protein
VPERQTEIEGGFDAQMANRRVLFSLTAYQKSSTDLLLREALAPVTGFTNQIINGGSMRIRGLEAELGVTPVQTAKTTWTANINWAMNRSLITYLPVPAFNIAGGTTGAIRIAQGGSATALWANDTLGPGNTLEFVYQTDAAPAWTAGLLNTVQHGAVSLGASLEFQRGGRMNLGSWRHWDIARNGYDFEYPGNCGGGLTLGACRLKYQNQMPMNYWVNTGYLKLREITLGVDLPKSFTNRLWTGIRSARLSVAGRDLITLSKIMGGNVFQGSDPSAANYHSGDQSLNNVEYTREFAAYPSSRKIWFQLDLGL